MKTIIIGLIVVGLIILVGVVSLNSQKPIGEMNLYIVYKNQKPVGTAFLQVPFKKDSEAPLIFSAYIDLNNNGKFGENELAVDKMAAPMEKTRPNIYPINQVLVAQLTGKQYKVKTVLEDRQQIWMAKVLPWDVTEISDPAPGYIGGGVGENNDWLVGIPEANAQTKKAEKENIFNKDVPDLGPRKGKPNECVPISTANSLLWLAKKHKFENKMPATPDNLVDELHKDFKTTKDGTKEEDFLPGKETITKERKLPLDNKKFDNVVEEGESLLWKRILSELKDGEDVELVIDLKESKTLGANKRHSVTVVGANNVDGHQNITVHDVNTPEGNDSYRVDRDGQIAGYVLGKAYVAFIISESVIYSPVRYVPPSTEPTKTPETPPSPNPSPIQTQPTQQPTPTETSPTTPTQQPTDQRSPTPYYYQ